VIPVQALAKRVIEVRSLREASPRQA